MDAASNSAMVAGYAAGAARNLRSPPPGAPSPGSCGQGMPWATDGRFKRHDAPPPARAEATSSVGGGTQQVADGICGRWGGEGAVGHRRSSAAGRRSGNRKPGGRPRGERAGREGWTAPVRPASDSRLLDPGGAGGFHPHRRRARGRRPARFSHVKAAAGKYPLRRLGQRQARDQSGKGAGDQLRPRRPSTSATRAETAGRK